MLKSELVDKLSESFPHVKRAELARLVDRLLARILDQLEKGGRVELRGFGSFFVAKRGARPGRNPKTGRAISVPPKKVPLFKVGKDLRERLQRNE